MLENNARILVLVPSHEVDALVFRLCPLVVWRFIHYAYKIRTIEPKFDVQKEIN
jgi:hypothetical protein